MDQLTLFSPEWIAIWTIGDQFEKLYPGTKYNLVFEEDPYGDKED